MKKAWILLVVFASSLWLQACAQASRSEYASGMAQQVMYEEKEQSYAGIAARPAPAPMRMAKSASYDMQPTAYGSGPVGGLGSAEVEGIDAGNSSANPEEPTSESPAVTPTARMVSHSAELVLRSADPNATADSAIALARSLGGELESRTAYRLSLKIPAAVFRSSLSKFEDLAILVDRQMWSEDITSQFQDTELRLQIARDKLDRLTVLLKRTTDANTKVELLAQIQVIVNEIKLHETLRTQLLQRVEFSHLGIRIDAFVLANHAEDIGAFRWIQGLDPVRTRSPLEAEALPLQAPEGYVALPKEQLEMLWACAASDGSEIWSRTLANNPQGDATFWAEAIRLREVSGYASAEVKQMGNWKMVILTSRGRNPFVWGIAVTTQDQDLHLVEFLWPTQALQEKHFSNAVKILEGELP